MTLREQIALAAQRIAESGAENPKLEAEVLAAHCLVKDRSFVIAHGTDELEIPGFDQLVARRAASEPLSYIIGWREFYGRRFKVTPAVLIPRHETEVLVEAALKVGRNTVLDVGTGSGCIAVTIALEVPDAKVTAIDLSPDAIEIAEHNAVALGANVEFIESNLFDRVQERKFELIVSNPPYVAYDDELAPQVKDHEPHQALYAEDQGMAFYKRLAAETDKHLVQNGTLLIELGDGQADRVAEIFRQENWQEPEFVKDLDGNKRVAVLKRDLP